MLNKYFCKPLKCITILLVKSGKQTKNKDQNKERTITLIRGRDPTAPDFAGFLVKYESCERSRSQSCKRSRSG
jgi:hypothetical protein